MIPNVRVGNSVAGGRGVGRRTWSLSHVTIPKLYTYSDQHGYSKLLASALTSDAVLLIHKLSQSILCLC